VTAKEVVQDILNHFDSNASYDEIMYQIHVREKIEAGLIDVERGRIVTAEEVIQDMREMYCL
jgi:predicted transcriptional regulator